MKNRPSTIDTQTQMSGLNIISLRDVSCLEVHSMAKTKTRRWDAADYLKSDEDMAVYLEAALEEGDAALFTAALGDIARAKGMTEIVRKTGLGRESLYKALSPDGNPEFATILKVVRSLGLDLHAAVR